MAGNVSSDKAAQRQVAEARRRALSPDVVARWGGEVQAHLAALPLLQAASTVAAYAAQAFEVPLSSCLDAFAARGAQVLLPRLVRGSRVLAFTTGHGGDAADFTPLPAGSVGVPLDTVGVWLVPGVAFTRDGRRLGRGRGYYDATLALRAPTSVLVGIAFECSIFDTLTTEPHDVSVDWLATERGVFRTRRGS